MKSVAIGWLAAVAAVRVLVLAETPQPAAHDPLAPLAFLVGEWRGAEDGRFGEGTGEREYRFMMGGRYLLSQNVSTFEPQEGLPEGDRHEDWTFFSYDRDRETFVLRQFNSEGFVNRFVLDPASAVPAKMVFVSEASENALPGLRARLTYEKASDDELRETFELAMPGEDFEVVLRNHWPRAAP
jgi:hypothetical protein